MKKILKKYIRKMVNYILFFDIKKGIILEKYYLYLNYFIIINLSYIF